MAKKSELVGSDEIVRQMQAEIGADGVVVVSGDVFNLADYVPQLQGDRSWEVWEEMRSSDPQIDAALFRLVAPIVTAMWGSFPAKKKKDKDGNLVASDFAEELAEDVRRNVLEADLLQDDSGWEGLIKQVLDTQFTFGFAAFEKVWGINGDGRQGIVKLGPRLPKTVRAFKVGSDHKLVHMEQWAYDYDGKYKQFLIPSDRLLLFTHRKEGNNWWGRSLLRSCYMPWKIWRTLAIVDSMRHERHGMGIPVIEVPQSTNSKVLEQAKKVAKELRAHQRQYVKLPPGFKLTWYFPNGSGTDIIGSMRYWDELKARALMNEGMNLGTTPNGTRSLGESKQRAMLMALTGYATAASNVFTSGMAKPYILQNYGAKGLAECPRIGIEKLNSLDIEVLAEVALKLEQARILTPDDPIEDHFRASLEWPGRDKKTAREAIPETIETKPGASGAQKEKPKPAPKGGSRGRKPVLKPFMAMRRDRLPHEMNVDFEGFMEYFEKEPERAWKDSIKPVRDDQIKEIVDVVVEATDKELAKKGSLKRPKLGTLANEVFVELKGSYQRGREALFEEKRIQQGAKKAAARRAAKNDPKATAAELAKMKRMAELFAEQQTDNLVSRAADVALRAKILGMDNAEVAERVLKALVEMSEPKVQSALTGEIVGAFTSGRNDAADTVKDEISTCYYSAIMDEGTCEPCEELDGDEHEYGDEAFATPNPNCAWPPHCRCVTIHVFKRGE